MHNKKRRKVRGTWERRSLWAAFGTLQHKIMMMKTLHMPGGRDESADNDEAWWQTNKSKVSQASCCRPKLPLLYVVGGCDVAPPAAAAAAPCRFHNRQQSSSLPQHNTVEHTVKHPHKRLRFMGSSSCNLVGVKNDALFNDGRICVCGMCDNHVYAWREIEN